MKKFVLFILIAVIFSCTKEDYFTNHNNAPLLNIVYGSALLKELDTIYKLGENPINITLRIDDNSKGHSYSLISDDSEIHYEVLHDSIFSLTPIKIGENKCEIIVEDSYGAKDQVLINLLVIDNYKPIPSLSFKLLDDNNYQVNASQSYDPDGTIVNYHFDYGINSFDFNEPIVKIWADHLENNGGVTLILTDDEGGKSDPVFFELNE